MEIRMKIRMKEKRVSGRVRLSLAVSCVLTGMVLSLFLSSCAGLFARAANDVKVVDEAGLLLPDEEEALQNRLFEIAERFQCDAAVVTVKSCGGMDVQRFTDLYYYENGYGYGPEIDGIMLLVSIGDRRFHLATRGSVIDAFTDYGLEVIDDAITPSLSEGAYAEAFETFADLTEEFLEEAAEDMPYDTNHTYREPMNAWLRILIAAVIGLAAAGGTLAVLIRQLRSVRTGREARDYVRSGSFRVTRAYDLFLYRTVTKRRVEHAPSGGGGGGSMTHSAPGGGGSAGGRSGSF